MTDNPPIRIYVNKIENRITFKIKTGHNLEHLTHETMKLLDISKSKINKDENGENVPHLETYFIYFTKNLASLKTFNLEFSYIVVWFTGQNSKPLEIYDKRNIPLFVT